MVRKKARRKTYVNNAKNRKLGIAGHPYGYKPRKPRPVQPRVRKPRPVKPRPRPVKPRPRPVQPRVRKPRPVKPRPRPVQPRPRPVQARVRKPRPVKPRPRPVQPRLRKPRPVQPIPRPVQPIPRPVQPRLSGSDKLIICHGNFYQTVKGYEGADTANIEIRTRPTIVGDIGSTTHGLTKIYKKIRTQYCVWSVFYLGGTGPPKREVLIRSQFWKNMYNHLVPGGELSILGGGWSNYYNVQKKTRGETLVMNLMKKINTSGMSWSLISESGKTDPLRLRRGP